MIPRASQPSEGVTLAKWIPKSYKIVKEENVPAKMRDGVTLYADVYRPDARRPQILDATLWI